MLSSSLQAIVCSSVRDAGRLPATAAFGKTMPVSRGCDRRPRPRQSSKTHPAYLFIHSSKTHPAYSYVVAPPRAKEQMLTIRQAVRSHSLRERMIPLPELILLILHELPRRILTKRRQCPHPCEMLLHGVVYALLLCLVWLDEVRGSNGQVCPQPLVETGLRRERGETRLPRLPGRSGLRRGRGGSRRLRRHRVESQDLILRILACTVL